MFHRVDGLTLIVQVLIAWAVANEVCRSNRVLSISEAREVFFLYLAFQSPLFCQLAVPLASNSLAFGVVIVLGVGKLPLVVGMRLPRTERFGDGQHSSPSSSFPVLNLNFLDIRSANRRGTLNLPLCWT